MEKNVQRIGVGNIRYISIEQEIIPPSGIFSFDSVVIKFDSTIRKFDEKL